jgi:hypothetical protein
MKPSYQMNRAQYLSEVIARTLAQSFKCDWYPNSVPGGEGWGEFALVRDGELKAMLRVFPFSDEADATSDHFLDLADANRVATTFRALGLKLIVARRAPNAIQIATLDGSTIDAIHVHPTDRSRMGWIIDAADFRRTVPLPDGKGWEAYRTAEEG